VDPINPQKSNAVSGLECECDPRIVYKYCYSVYTHTNMEYKHMPYTNLQVNTLRNTQITPRESRAQIHKEMSHPQA
jgi:hypothetical protein